LAHSPTRRSHLPDRNFLNTKVFPLVAAVWILGFLWFFFACSIEDPDIPRTALWSMMADEVLGLNDVLPESTHTAPASGIMFLPQRLPFFGWAAIILALAAAHGDAICQLTLRRCRLFRTERIVICLGTGLGVVSLVTLCCGLAGQLNTAVILVPAVASFAVSCALRWKSRHATSAHLTVLPGKQSSSLVIRILVLLVIVPFAFYLMFGAVSPPMDFDVREYHLQGPKEWIQQGQIKFLPHNVYTSFPFLTEMLSLTGMIFAEDWWRGALVGQIVLSTFQLLSALSVFSIARRWISIDVAWLATLIYLTTPWTLRISLIAYAEGSLAFYLISSTMCALLVSQLPKRGIRISLVAGLLAGNAMASKYTGLISVILPTAAVIAFQFWRSRSASTKNCVESAAADGAADALRTDAQRLISLAAAFSLGVSLMIAPWLLKNLFETGNPVYPLGYNVFGGSEWTPEMDARWKPAHAASEHRISRIPEHILGAAVYNKWTSALLFGLAIPSAFLLRRNKTIPVVLLLIGYGFATWWAFTHRIDRFWIPLIPLLSITAGSTWLISSSKLWKTFLITVIAAVTLFNVRFCGLALVGYHVGLTNLEAARQQTIRSDIKLLNNSLPANAKVLMVGEAEIFDATFPLVYNTVFDECLFEMWTTLPENSQLPVTERRMLPPELILEKLNKNGITHVLVNWGEVLRYRMTYGYTEYVVPARFGQLEAERVLSSRRILLQRPWDTLSDSEQAMVKSWRGDERIHPDDSALFVVELYEVTRQSERQK